jgi:phosphoketolase
MRFTAFSFEPQASAMINPLVRRLLMVNSGSSSLRAGLYEISQNDPSTAPEVVLAAAGDIPTLEIVAAAWWLRHTYWIGS